MSINVTITGRASKLSEIAIDTDLAMGAHAITINVGGLIDGKDISTLVMLKTLTGTYTGDAGVNKAIAHGCGVVPKMVIVMGTAAASRAWILVPLPTKNMVDGIVAVTCTEMNATNFYVNSAAINANGISYYWIAFYE